MAFLDDSKWRPKRTETKEQPKERRLLKELRWGGRKVTFSSLDGVTWQGPTQEPGLIVVLRHNSIARTWVARLEDRATGDSWSSGVKRTDAVALANLERQVKRVGRAL